MAEESTISDQSFLPNYLEATCSFLNKTQILLLVEKLKTIGVSTKEDLKFVQESDLSDVNILSVIQARKVFMNISNDVNDNSLTVNLSVPPNSPVNSVSSCSESSSSYNTDQSPTIRDWLSKYKVPWERFPKAFKTACESNRFPTSSDIREVVRILVDDILESCKRPSSRDIYVIASRLVDQHRTSLLDRVGNRIIGTGYSSWINRIQERLNNVHRKSSSSSDESNKRKLQTESDGETLSIEEAQLSKQFLIREAGKHDIDYSRIFESMNKTFCYRNTELGKMTVEEIKAEWPFMFEKTCCLQHFEKLTQIKLIKEYQVNSAKTKSTFLRYMKTVKNEKVRNIFKEIEEFEAISGEVYPESLSLLRLILAYFKEEGLVENHARGTDTRALLNYKRPEGAPIIAIVGNLYENPIFHVMIEGTSVQTFANIEDALLVMFSSYYIMNLRYLKSAYLTLEFLQRTFFGVNPTRGTKGKKKTRNSVHPKVLQLTSEMRIFEQEYSTEVS